MKYHCLALCRQEDESVVRDGVDQFFLRREASVSLEIFPRREQLLYRLREASYDAVLVWLPGALGMESALGVRDFDRQVPLVWISEDAVFALESYRMGVSVFLHAPSTPQQISKALERCLGLEVPSAAIIHPFLEHTQSCG